MLCIKRLIPRNGGRKTGKAAVHYDAVHCGEIGIPEMQEDLPNGYRKTGGKNAKRSYSITARDICRGSEGRNRSFLGTHPMDEPFLPYDHKQIQNVQQPSLI